MPTMHEQQHPLSTVKMKIKMNKLTLVEGRGPVVGHIQTQWPNNCVHGSTIVRSQTGATA